MPAKGVLLFNTLHYASTPVDDTDDSYMKIYFKKNKVNRVASWVNVGSGGGVSKVEPPLVIPPDTVMRFTTSAKFEFPVSIQYLNPHMHFLGKSFKAYAVTPSYDTIPMVKIDAWDFNWQDFYRFDPMLTLPRGSWVHVEGVYDNTRNNPRNPFHPPRICREGDFMKTTDEMLDLGIFYFPYREGDEYRKSVDSGTFR
jgi:hypothetical protein